MSMDSFGLGRLGAHRGGVDPARLRNGRGRLLVADHHGARAVGGRTGLVEPDRVPEHLRGEHRLDRALDRLAMAVKLNPALPGARQNYAMVLARAGKFEE